MNFRRLRDRPAVIHPQSTGERVTDGPERQKRYREINDDEALNWEDTNLPPAEVTMSIQGTQRVRKERTHVSYEIKNRKETAPCIEDMLKIRELHLKEQARQAMLAKRREHQQVQMSKLELALEMGETGDEVIDEEDPVTADSDNEDVSEEEFKKRALLMKEKKITFQRASNINHKEMTTFQHIQIALGIYWYKNKIKREKYSKVFPWLYVGDKTMAANLTFLAGQGFTHILNVTKEVKNYFGEKFVYLRLSVADKENENLSVRYTKAFQFIQRVVASKGKLFVHCTAGSSRAPAIVIAYLIAIRKIPLFDALEYMTAVRTCVCPNLGFLYQLAELEAKEGMGSSVLYNKRWDKMYDFNKLRRGMNLERRATAGVLKTAWMLHHPLNIVYDKMDLWEHEKRRKAIRNAKGIYVPSKEFLTAEADD